MRSLCEKKADEKKKRKKILNAKNEDYAETIVKTKFLHNVPLMYEKILSIFCTDHATERPLVAVFQKVSKNYMCSHEYSWAAHIKK